MADYLDLKLDSTGDLELDSSGDLVLVRGAAAIAQGVTVFLRGLRGEWFLDTEWGMPYLNEILVKRYGDRTRLESLFRAKIRERPGVARVAALGMNVDPYSRELSVSVSIVAEDGTTEKADVSITNFGK